MNTKRRLRRAIVKLYIARLFKRKEIGMCYAIGLRHEEVGEVYPLFNINYYRVRYNIVNHKDPKNVNPYHLYWDSMDWSGMTRRIKFLKHLLKLEKVKNGKTTNE